MKRFLSAAATVLFLSCLGLEVGAQPAAAPSQTAPIKLRLVSSFSKFTPTGVQDFTKRVEELSGGVFQIIPFHADEIVPGQHVMQAVSNATVQFGLTTGHHYYAIDPAFHLLATVPFGFETRAHLAWRARPDVKAIFERMLDTHKIIAMPCSVIGRFEDMWSRKALTRVKDIDGMKLRVGGFIGDVYMKLGAVPHQIELELGDLYPALDKGVIDGVQFSSPAVSHPLGFPQVATHYYYPSLISPAAILDLIVHKDAWAELPRPHQQAVEQACAENVEKMTAEYERLDRRALRQFADKDRVKAKPLPAVIQKRLYAESQAVLKTKSKESAALRDLLPILDQMKKQTLGASIK